MATLRINGSDRQVALPDDAPLLWAIRDGAGLTGTKFGCGIGVCGACTVHVDGRAVRSCMLTVGAAVGHEVTTIEAMATDPVGARVQAAWLDAAVIQCGYCQSGQIMSATALLKRKPQPDDRDIDRAMAGNICRCGTYPRIRAAIRKASA